MDENSIYNIKKHSDKLIEASYVADELGRGKNDNGNGGITYASFLAPNCKIK